MKIEEALKETGKAFLEDFESSYVEINEEGYLAWYNMKNQRELDKVEFECIVDNCWQSYHEVKEIRPEVPGELWERGVSRYITFGDSRNLRMFKQDGGEYYLGEFIPSGPVHGQGGWERLLPKVEDDSVERIEIEAFWKSDSHRFEVVSPLARMDLMDIGPHAISFSYPKT